MKEKYHELMMRIAYMYAAMSSAKRRKVGCVIVKDNILYPGYNGTPSGWDNCCEGSDGKTLPHVMHAEQNALDKMMLATVSSKDAVVFVTTAPCIECAKRLFGAKVCKVFYDDIYHNADGIDFLQNVGVHVERIAKPI